MKILVLGASGMLGHKMFQVLSPRFPDVWGSVRADVASGGYQRVVRLLGTDRLLAGVDVEDLHSLEPTLRELAPDVIVNCIGVIKQRPAADHYLPSITVNALLPHFLAKLASEWSGRVIHFSTDCVFSGRRGDYTENDVSDAEDLYGRTKFLGEVATGNAVTLRTSIIGRELHHHRSLLDWFLGQNGQTIRGYTEAWWSGVTTNHLADLVARLIADHPDLHGLYQVSSGRLSKFELLKLLREAYELDVDIVPDANVKIDRSLRGDRLQQAIGYQCPPWDVLIKELLGDPTPYNGLGAAVNATT